MPELLKVTEVAKWLRVSESTVRNMIRRKSFPIVRIGKKTIRIRRSDIQAMLDGDSLGSGGGQDAE